MTLPWAQTGEQVDFNLQTSDFEPKKFKYDPALVSLGA